MSVAFLHVLDVCSLAKPKLYKIWIMNSWIMIINFWTSHGTSGNAEPNATQMSHWSRERRIFFGLNYSEIFLPCDSEPSF